jgi:hypothetical protein
MEQLTWQENPVVSCELPAQSDPNSRHRPRIVDDPWRDLIVKINDIDYNLFEFELQKEWTRNYELTMMKMQRI